MIHNKLFIAALFLMGGSVFAQMPGRGVQHVQVEKAVVGKDSVSRRSIGHVEAQKTVRVRAAVEGFLMEARFEEGSMVQAGDVLFVINPVRYEAALKQAEANLAEIDAQIIYAEAKCKRISNLANDQASAQVDAETAKAKVEELKARRAEAQANLTRARKDLDDCTVRAEISGRVGRMSVSPGNYVSAGDQLVTITQENPIYVRFPLSQSDVNDIFRGPGEIGNMARVCLTTADGHRYPSTGKVEIVDNQLTGSTDTYSLWATFPNEHGVLTHNGIGAMQIEMEDTQTVVQVPLTAVHHDSKGSFVYVVGECNKVERRPVVVGSISGRMQSVYKGVQEGETVITDGSHKTTVGAVVVPVFPDQQVMRGGNKGSLADIVTPVRVAGVTMTTDPTVLTCQGARVEAVNRIDIRPLVNGILEGQNFKEGDIVEQGSVLFTIDSTRYQAAVDAQKARIAQLDVRIEDARDKYERKVKLLEKGATSQDDVDSAKATMDELTAQKEAAEATLAIAEDDLSRCTIRAGITGQIGRVAVSPGNLITDTRTPLTALVQLSPVYVRFSLSETSMLSHFGNSQQLIQDADITLVTASGEVYSETGHVAFCDNEVQTSTDTLNVWAVFDNADTELRPGGVVTIHIKRKPDIQVMAVPAEAVQVGTNGHFVFVVKDGRAVATRVWCGDLTEDGTRRIIYSGIETTDQVIVSGMAELENGDAVSILPGEASQNAQK